MKRIGIAAFALGALTAAGWVFTAAWGQCTGVFPNGTLCGNYSGAPAPPGIVSGQGFILGPTTANANDLAIWSGSSAINLADGTTTSIAGAYTFLGQQTYSATEIANGPAVFNSTFNSTSSFQINGNVITWPGTTGTVMFLQGSQTVSGNKTFGGTQNFTGTFQINGQQISVPGGQGTTITLSASPITVQTFLSATTGTYLTPTGTKWIRVRGVGGGGGGAGAGASTAPAGATGTATTFGSALIVGNPGLGGAGSTAASNVNLGGAGGTASLGATIGLALSGAFGSNGGSTNATGGSSVGGKGGDSCFGGGSPGGVQASGNFAGATAIAAVVNTGGGGGGAAGTNNGSQSGGAGGGAGGCFDAIINSPTTSFAFQVGAGGAGGIGTGTGAATGQTGAIGGIWVEEHYNF